MTVKILVTEIGQQIVSEVKQVEQKETKEVIAYWLVNPRVINYVAEDNEQVNVNFGAYCLVSNETEFSLKADHVVAILEPRPEVIERYNLVIERFSEAQEEEETTEVTDESGTDNTEDGTDSDSPE